MAERLTSLLAAAAIVIAAAVTGAAPAAAAPQPKAGPGQWFIHDYGIDEMWKTTTGEGVKVAVIDSGIEDEHENLKDTVAAAKDFSGSGKDGTTPVGERDIIHHGTAVAGVIAGNGTGAGPRGVAPDAQLLSASMWLGAGAGDDAPSSREQAAQAIRWSVDQGAEVINLSLGWSDPAWPEMWDEAFSYAYEHDVLVVACVGNASQGATRVWSPATIPGVVGVGGVGRDGRIDTGSTAPGTGVDLMGPSEGIPVPYYDGGYGVAEGCSFAAPIVSGVAALIRSAHPDYSADDVAAVLEGTAKDVDGHKGRTAGKTIDPIVGYGRIDPVAALQADKPTDPPSAADELANWVTMHRRAEPAQASQDNPESADAQAAAHVDAVVASAPEDAPPRVVGPILLMSAGAAAVIFMAGAFFAFVKDRRRLSAE